VLVRPLTTRAEAMEVLAGIQQQGIDSFLIGTGKWRNGISLGLFSRQQAAQEKLESAREAGLDVTMEQLARNGKLRGLRGGKSLYAAVSRENLQFRGLALSLQHCSGVAKANKNL